MKMRKITEFLLLTSPLDGSNLIEAGAGTGKTFTIAAIVIRLLLEKKLKIDEILVVTYTNAATEELRDRIRIMIRRAVGAFTRGADDDPFLDGLVRGHSEPDQAASLLKAALRDFDGAAVYTIHRFCQRTLFENAFESLNPFAATLMPDERPLQEEIVQDFWRRRFYDAPIEVVAYAQERKYDLASLVKLVRSASQLRSVRLVPATGPVELASLPVLRQAFARTAGAWKGCRGDVLDKLQDAGLNRTKYKNPKPLVAGMDRYLSGRTPIPAFSAVEKFTVSGLIAATKKGATAPDHPFFHLCEDLKEAIRRFYGEMEAYLLHLKTDLFLFVREELPRRKEKRQLQSFEDLLENLHRALSGPENDALVDDLQNHYRAALIDEFQDTDPVQYAIFRRIFHRDGHTLFLIGDPKQAIYSFRGADLFTYMAAREDVDHLYTLTRNWRAAPALIRAINAIFTRHERPFVYPQVMYHEAVAAEQPSATVPQEANDRRPPLRIWHFGKEQLENLGALGNRERARTVISAAVAAEISRLIQPLNDGEKPGVSAGKIAVLVRDRYEARIIQNALRRNGIPSVLHGGGNVFDTVEAEELLQLIAAIAEPNRESLLRTALTTAMLGQNGEDLVHLRESDRHWEAWLFRFRQYHDIWEVQGFMVMFRLLVTQERVRERILAFPDGERRLTNYLQLAEILHQEEAERRPGLAGLVKWLLRMHDPETARSEEHELHLESDEEAVRIVTVHKSKGLEYPIVFCPFLWGGSGIKDAIFTYHEQNDSGDGWTLNMAIDGLENPRRADAERENLAENIRLFYVALTRAKECCYVVWGRFKGGETSAPAYIFHPPQPAIALLPEEESEVILSKDAHLTLDALESRLTGMTEIDFRHDLDELAIRSRGAIEIEEITPSPLKRLALSLSSSEALTCRTFSETIERQERITSFSYFVSGHIPEMPSHNEDYLELPDHDGLIFDHDQPPITQPSGIFAFPRGARAGTLLHDILECTDFQEQDDRKREDLVSTKLKEHGFASHWRDAICETLQKVIHTPLSPTIPDLTLTAISSADRLNELEFYYPLKTIGMETLNRLFLPFEGNTVTGGTEKTGRLTFPPAKGSLKGFIDLVFQYAGRFYLVDWKSNHLGNRIEDYGQEALSEVMSNEWYTLQYHLYVLALHRYLRTRIADYDYDRHFGGVFYIFLRGVDPARGPELGIFRDRPERTMIDRLERELIGNADER